MGSYRRYKLARMYNLAVSGPYRGLGWVLPDFIGFVAWGATAFPAPIEVLVGSYNYYVEAGSRIDRQFPAPREAWVVSYICHTQQMTRGRKGFRPLSRLG